MPYEASLIALWLSGLCLLVLLLGRKAEEPYPNYIVALPFVAGLFGCLYFTPTAPAQRVVQRPVIVGLESALKLGLWAQTHLPARPPDRPVITWLEHTQGGRRVQHKPLVIFAQPERSQFRRAGLVRGFQNRFGWPNVWETPFQPRAIIVHSTEGESEAHAFAIFNRNTRAQYLGGVWTHFAVAPGGQIFQYGPLNRVSKGQAGLNDIGVGIEIVGTASLWSGTQQTRRGSIIRRWQQQDRAQLEAVQDLIHSLQEHYQIPTSRIYSHEMLGHIRELKGAFPDYHWLRLNIRDRVYLNLTATLDEHGQPENWYSFLEPYDRQDPGRDVMSILYASTLQ